MVYGFYFGLAMILLISTAESQCPANLNTCVNSVRSRCSENNLVTETFTNPWCGASGGGNPVSVSDPDNTCCYDGSDTSDNTAFRVQCGSNPTRWCYLVDVPACGVYSKSVQVVITNLGDGVFGPADHHFFDIYFTITGWGNSDCVNPTIDFEYEGIDHEMDGEYLQVYEDYPPIPIAPLCVGGEGDCGTWFQCITGHPLNNGAPIPSGTTYLVTVEQGPQVDKVCQASQAGSPPSVHDFATYARLTLTCGGAPPPGYQ